MIKKNVFILFLFFIFIGTISGTPNKIILRYDDPQLQADVINDSLFAMLQKQEIPFCIAVIPCDSTEKLVCDTSWEYLPALKKAVAGGTIEIMLHGLNHQKLNISTGEGEFNGVDYQEQYRRILKGKHLLDSVLSCNITTFIPPWNVYDANTLKALDKCKFKIISSCFPNQSTENENIAYYPMTIDSPLKLLEAINNNKTRKGIIVLMFHRYDFEDSFTVSDFEKILCEIKTNHKNVEFITFSDLIKKGEISDKERIKANEQNNFLSKKLKLGGMLYSTAYCNNIRIWNGLLHSLFSLGISVLLYWLLLRKKRINWYKVLSVVSIAIFSFVFVYFRWLPPMKSILFIVFLSAGNQLFLHYKN